MNNNLLKKFNIMFVLIVILLNINITVHAEDISDCIDVEQASFVEEEGEWNNIDEFEQYVDGIYNISENARANMVGVIRLGKSGSKVVCNYSTTYAHTVDRLGVKDIKFQYKGSLGIWHTIITLDDRYRTNAATYQGTFSCTGVIDRTYRVKGTHYIIDGSYTETRNNVTEGLTF